MSSHGTIWQASYEGEKLFLKSHLFLRCENYLQYITKNLKLDEEAPMHINFLQMDSFINGNEESFCFLAFF